MQNSNIVNRINLHVSFFSPPTVCTIISLHNAVTRKAEIKGREAEFIGGPGDFKVLDFLIDKIVEQSVSPGALTLAQYEANILETIKDKDLVIRLQSVVNAITDLNSFYKILYRTIEELKEIKMSKTDSSSIIDIFLRRLAAYFQKLSFKEIISLYQLFMAFKLGKQVDPLLNEFIVGHQLEELKFNIQNYSKDIDYDVVNKKIHQLMPNDKHNRSEYLNGMNEIIGKNQSKGLDCIYRFFDKEFSALFQEKVEGGVQTNTINHSVLSIAFAHLKLGFLDEAIKGINEGLRLSQNNSDEESINHCIIYLYQINSCIGKIEEEARLTEHAITHSINLNNVLLMIFSCLNYSQLEKHYDCHKENNILSARNIQWTDALHFARKKLYSNFQNTCKGLYHFQRNLIIPLFLHKMAILNHVPDLRQIFLQGIYNVPHVRTLDHAKLYLRDSKIESLIKNARICYYRKQVFTYSNLIDEIEKQLQTSTNLHQFTQYWNFKNEILIERNLINEALESVFNLISYCKQKDFKKHEYIQCLLQLSRIHKMQERYYETLNILEEIKLICDMSAKQSFALMNLEKIDVLLRLENIGEAMLILKKIEEENSFEKSNYLASQFYLVKSSLLFKLVDLVGHTLPESAVIYQQAEQCEKRGIHYLLNDMNLIKTKLHLEIKMKRTNSGNYNIPRALEYLERVLGYFSQIRVDYQYNSDASSSIGKKLVDRLEKMLG